MDSILLKLPEESQIKSYDLTQRYLGQKVFCLMHVSGVLWTNNNNSLNNLCQQSLLSQ
jgi:hypothetical protein